MNFSLKRLTTYCLDHSSEIDDILNHLERETHLKVLSPQMVSGPFQGQLLSFISRMVKPKRILEIGTFTGYSTICLAQGLDGEGLITTIESNEELKYISQKYFDKAGILSRVHQIWGDARIIINELNEMFDIVFIDAGKQDYAFYFDQVIDKVNKQGIIIVDNVLWSGKVTSQKKDNDTKSMDEFNKKIKNDERVDNILLPVRDGISLIIKK